MDKNEKERYNSFSLSWKSSRSGGEKVFENASPVEEIVINIEECAKDIEILKL